MSERRTEKPGEPVGPDVEYMGQGRWIIRSYSIGRSILRDAKSTKQGSFGVDLIPEQDGTKVTGAIPVVKPPLLFLEGEDHRVLRLATAQYFTPKKIRQEYTPVIERACESIMTELADGQIHEVSDLSLELATVVACQVLGLVESPQKRTARNIEAITSADLDRTGLASKVIGFFQNTWPSVRFYFQDVRPAVLARKKHPQDDLISHLMSKGHGHHDLLSECIMYGGAGVVTTREFITVAAWHFLTKAEVRAEYLAADEKRRLHMLEEILRLEPIVGQLGRIVTEPVTVPVDGREVTIPVGDMIHIHTRKTNADAAAVGDAGDCLRFDREYVTRSASYGLSFGEGHHKCPGQHLAMKESDMLLTRMLALDLELVQEPTVTWNDLIHGYEVRGLTVRVRN